MGALRVAGLFVLLGLIALVVTASPKLNLLWIELSPGSADSSNARVYFLSGGKVRHEDALAVAVDAKKTKLDSTEIFAHMPRHLDVESVFLDLGTEPGQWEIARVYFRSWFLLFRLDAFEWRNADLAALARPYLNHSELDAGKTLTVTTKKYPHRFHLKLDRSTLKQSVQLVVAKVFMVAVLVLLYLLLISRYFWGLFSSRIEDALILRANAENNRRAHRTLIMIGSALLLLLMIVMGNENILSPGLYIEDSMELTDALAGNLSLFSPETYSYYRGYPVFLSEWFVAASSLFPLGWQPILYVVIGMFFAWLAINVMSTTGLITHPLMLLIAPLLLFIGSFNVPAMFLTLTGTFFSTTALLMALAVRPAPSNNVIYLFCFMLMCALALSGPYAPQVLPMACGLVLLMGSRRKTLLLLCLMCVAVLYTRGSASGMVQFENLLDPAIRAHFYNSVVQHLFLFGLSSVREFWVGLLICSLIIGLLVLFREDRLYVKHSLIFIASSLVSLLTYFISFKYGQYAGELISAHLIIAQFTWMMFVVITIDRFLRAGSSRGWQVGVGMLTVIGIGLLLYGKKSVEAPLEKLRPDSDLMVFLDSVEYADGLVLAENEFVQLWDVNHQGYVTSYRLGARGGDANSISRERFPEPYRKFVLPVDLEREDNMLLQLRSDSSLWYSNQTVRILPHKLTKEHRMALRLY